MFELVVGCIFVVTSIVCGFRSLVLSHSGDRDVEQKTEEQGRDIESYQDPTSGGRGAAAPSEPMRGERDSDLRE